MGQQEGWIRSNSKVRTDSTHILAKVRRLNQLELVGETLHATFDALSRAAPAWVRGHLPAEWGMRSGPEPETPPVLRQLPQVQTLQLVWQQC